MARGARGRRRGRRKSKAARSKRSSASSSSSSKSSSKSKSKRSTAASKRKRVRSVAKAKRAAARAAKSSTSTSSSTSSSSKNKTKKKNSLRNRLKNKIASKTLKGKLAAKGITKKTEVTKNKTISAAQSRKQVRQNTKDKIATRKKINMPSLGRIGRTLRNIRQPMSMLSDAGVRSFLGKPAQAIAQGLANSPYTSDFNKRTRDMSKLSPQQQRKYQRLSEKTGRDYSIRNPTFRLNMGVDTLANFGKFADKGWYKALPKSIKSLKVDKQFYGNPMKKGWHSSQRTGRGQGITGRETRGVPDGMIRDMIGGRAAQDAARAQAQQQEQAVRRQYEYDNREYEMSKSQMGPQQDWLSSLYTAHNINKGQLDQGARDYWSNEAKTKGRDAVMQSIIGTSKAQGTYGGRKKPRRINTGSRPRNLEGNRGKNHKRMIAKTLAATMAGRVM